MVAVNIFYTKIYTFGNDILMPFHPKYIGSKWPATIGRNGLKALKWNMLFRPDNSSTLKKLGRNDCFLIETY